jgi:ribosomal protein S12 methylthiotransferase accessory factor
MIDRPRFRSHYRVECEEAVTLYDERGSLRLESPLLRRLAPLLDGRSTVEEIAQRLGAGCSPVDVAFGLAWLEEHGLVVDGGAGLDRNLAALVDGLGLDPAAALRRLRTTRVSVLSFADLPTVPLEESLRAAGVRLEAPADLTVAVTDDYLRAELVEVDRRARAAGGAWLPVKPVGALLWIGPLLTSAGRRCCWRCLTERLRGWRDDGVPQPSAPPTALVGLGLAASEVLKWVLAGEDPDLDRALVCFDLGTLAVTRHAVVPVPRCTRCAAPVERREPAPIVLVSRTKMPEGGDRAAAPDAILRRYGHLVSPITGIVDRLAPSLEDSHELLHVYTATYAQPQREGATVLPRERRRSAGRGVSSEQARAAALCEALERHSGFFRGDEPGIRAAYGDLGPDAVHPNACLLVSEAQYATRECWNRRDLPFHWIPRRFREDRAIDWLSAWSLTAGTRRWLPTAYCYYDVPQSADERFCRADSNGCAAGSCREEAILHGFFELVERDALALWWYNRARRPGVDLETFRHPYLREVIEWHARAGRQTRVLDITTDLGLPAFVAISRERPERQGDLILGAGAHLDAAAALTKAVTEINQMIPGFVNGRPRRILSEEPGAEDSYLIPDPSLPARCAKDYPLTPSEDLRADVEACLDRARRSGLEVLVVDQTRADVGLPVVRVVAPGLRLFRARFAPGRLYATPVALGWRSSPLPEDQLNPIHILI